MDSRTPLTLDELAARVADASGLSNESVTAALRALFAAAADRLAANGRAELPGIGVFVTDPATDAEVEFVADAAFADAVNEPFAMFEPLELSDDTDLAIATSQAEDSAEALTEEPTKQPTEASTETQTEVLTEAPTEAPTAPVAEAASEVEMQPDNVDDSAVETPQSPVEEPSPTINAPVSVPSHPRVYRLGWLAVGLVIGIIIGFLSGALVYKQPSALPTQEQAEAVDNASDAGGVDASDAVTDNPSVAATAAEVAPEAVTPAAPATATLRTDTVTTRRYITHMAKEYYGDRIFWVYIYEANADVLGHPERTLPGTVVKIPTPESIPADPHDAEDIKRARALAAEIYARFQ